MDEAFDKYWDHARLQREEKIMSMQGSGQIRSGDRCDPAPSPQSINFLNPGTVAHVVGELESNLTNLHQQRESLEARHAEETAQFEAAHGDTRHRIEIIEAGLQRYREATQGTPGTTLR